VKNERDEHINGSHSYKKQERQISSRHRTTTPSDADLLMPEPNRLQTYPVYSP